MPGTKFLNVVFQGGGVRGIAYAGVLASMPKHVNIYAAAGTSAGSIVAGLLAIGRSPSEIKSILEDKELRALVDEADSERMTRLSDAWRELKKIWIPNESGGKISYRRAMWFAHSQKNVFSDLREVWTAKGLHSSAKLREFFNKIFENKTFAEIKIEDLKIVAADVNNQRYRTYSKAQDLTRPIAEAVHASASIPVFFEPLMLGVGGGHLVDGGVLSNFPSFLFAQGHFPTVGFRLADISAPAKIDSTAAYLRALLLTMTDAHDKERGNPPHFAAYEIETPETIPSTKFALSEKDIKELYDAGLRTGKRVRWDEHASEKQVVLYYDPKPHEALQLSLEQAHSLFDEHSHLLVEYLEQKARFVCTIENDWSTSYSTTNTLLVKGSKHLALARFVGFGIPSSPTGSQSLVDFPFVAEELSNGSSKRLITLPAYNSENEKGFILFFVPPISSDQERTYHTRFTAFQEFAKTLGKGKSDFVAYSVLKRADQHRLNLTLEILVDSHLPELRFDAPFAFDREGPVEDPASAKIFRKYRGSVSTEVSGSSRFAVQIKR